MWCLLQSWLIGDAHTTRVPVIDDPRVPPMLLPSPCRNSFDTCSKFNKSRMISSSQRDASDFLTRFRNFEAHCALLPTTVVHVPFFGGDQLIFPLFNRSHIVTTFLSLSTSWKIYQFRRLKRSWQFAFWRTNSRNFGLFNVLNSYSLISSIYSLLENSCFWRIFSPLYETGILKFLGKLPANEEIRDSRGLCSAKR